MLAWLQHGESQLPSRLRQVDQGVFGNTVNSRPGWAPNGNLLSKTFKDLGIHFSGRMIAYYVGGLMFHSLY
jgi:hypothetical protein